MSLRTCPDSDLLPPRLTQKRATFSPPPGGGGVGAQSRTEMWGMLLPAHLLRSRSSLAKLQPDAPPPAGATRRPAPAGTCGAARLRCWMAARLGRVGRVALAHCARVAQAEALPDDIHRHEARNRFPDRRAHFAECGDLGGPGAGRFGAGGANSRGHRVAPFGAATAARREQSP